MNRNTILSLEKLNQIELTEAERNRLLDFYGSMSREKIILANFDTSDVERMVHVIPLTNVLREDVPAQPFSRDELLEGAPEQMDGYWQVPRLIE